MSDFKDLFDAAEKFLTNMSEATGLDNIKKEERARPKEVFPETGDSFNSRLDRLKNLIKNPASIENSPKETKSTASPIASAAFEKNSKLPVPRALPEVKEINNASPPPPEIFDRFVLLLEKMTGVKPLGFDKSWSELDRMSVQVKKAFSSAMMGKTSPEKLTEWTRDLVSLAEEMFARSPSFGPHENAWMQWSNNTLKEMAALSGWLSPPTNELSVAKEYIGKGEKIPASPSSFKSHQEKLQVFSDFLESAKNQTPFTWGNTREQSLFMSAWDELSKENVSSKKETEWKEKALDFYAIFNGRFTLLSSPTRSLKNDKKSAPSC